MKKGKNNYIQINFSNNLVSTISVINIDIKKLKILIIEINKVF